MTRSVAEVIGFKVNDADYNVRLTDDGLLDAFPVEPTVDDLLAWLREQDCEVESERDLTNDLLFLKVHRWGPTNDEDFEARVSGSTLLAALERAVLAVAGES